MGSGQPRDCAITNGESLMEEIDGSSAKLDFLVLFCWPRKCLARQCCTSNNSDLPLADKYLMNERSQSIQNQFCKKLEPAKERKKLNAKTEVKNLMRVAEHWSTQARSQGGLEGADNPPPFFFLGQKDNVVCVWQLRVQVRSHLHPRGLGLRSAEPNHLKLEQLKIKRSAFLVLLSTSCVVSRVDWKACA